MMRVEAEVHQHNNFCLTSSTCSVILRQRPLTSLSLIPILTRIVLNISTRLNKL